MDTETIIVTIMGREFRINCSEEEREGLLLAVSYLDKKMQQIKNERKIVGTEQIAIVAALHITHELLTMRPIKSFDTNEFKRRIKSIESKLDELLPGKENQ
ncbi:MULTISPECIES: cell division protein ZapA [unclassified Nitrosomonas]|uniref:cell division protein ZapA n=1 Tax=unclassified Nitrosomonas TaxID=2609265 RepID=UPI000B8686D5|nr:MULTISPECIES: cell division protein ZapA [unclassified Nitrosomonas]MDV6343385.1 cell division protein ZapA [Nitrosomonas sp. Is37]